jgi:hypothetical protein
MRSYHDDLVMALAIGCWVRDTALQANQVEVEYKKAMLGGIMKSETRMNTQIKGQHGYSQSFQQRYEEEIKQAKEFFWIYKG